MDKFKSQSTVVITLEELQTNKIPKEIGQLTNVIDLTIQLKKNEGNWAVYPPLSWYETRELKEPFRTIPESIGDLKSLKSLRLVNLDIHELPETFSELKNLEFLDLSMNKLDLSNELPKLKKLSKLETLRILGNHFDEAEIQQFIREFPEIKVKYKSEAYPRKTYE